MVKTLAAYRERLRSLKKDESGMNMAQTIFVMLGMAILAGISTLAVFQVVPWFQDGAAERETDALYSAQETYYSMYGVNRQDEPRYGSAQQLVDAGFLKDKWTTDFATVNRVDVGPDSGWEVFVRSASNKVIYTNSERDKACTLADESAMPTTDQARGNFTAVSCVGDTD